MSRLYSESTHYVGTIESQEFTSGYEGAPQLVLRVRLEGKAKKQNDIKLTAGEDPLEESLCAMRTLYFDLSPTGRNLTKVLAELASLGFTDTSLPRLHPDNRRHHSFIGQKCLVRVWYKPGADATSEKEKWFLVTPRQVETFELSKFEELFKENADLYVSAASSLPDAAG